MRSWLTGLPILLCLTACSSDKPMINTSQSLVMESSVLSAGIITVPAQGSIVAASQMGNLTASKVRLYLYL